MRRNQIVNTNSSKPVTRDRSLTYLKRQCLSALRVSDHFTYLLPMSPMRESAGSEPATAVYILARTGDHGGGCDERWTDANGGFLSPMHDLRAQGREGSVSQVAIGGHTVFPSPVASRRSSCHCFPQDLCVHILLLNICLTSCL